MTEVTKESQRGKSPKAGKGVGRKPKAIKTAVASVRLPVDTIKNNLINADWLSEAVDLKLQQINWKNDRAELIHALMDELLSVADENDAVDPRTARIIELLQQLGVALGLAALAFGECVSGTGKLSVSNAR